MIKNIKKEGDYLKGIIFSIVFIVLALTGCTNTSIPNQSAEIIGSENVSAAPIESEWKTIPEPERPTTNSFVEKSFNTDAPVYSTISQLIEDADYIFNGTFSRIEPVQGASWHWEIYTVKRLYKGVDTPQEIRVISDSTSNLDSAKHEIGSEYFVFATAYELPVYPYPLINPIYNQTVFEVMNNGQLSLSEITDKSMIPAVFDEQFVQNPEDAILESPELLKNRAVNRVVNQYQNLTEALTNSDLVVRVIFDNIEKVNQYVSICQVKEIKSEYEANQEIILPISIAVNEDIKVGEEYIIFLKYDALGESLILSSREGAIISHMDDENKWNEALAILNKAN